MLSSTINSILSVSLVVLGLASASPAGLAPTSPLEPRGLFNTQATKDVEMRCGGVHFQTREESDPEEDCNEAAGDMQKEFQVPGQWERFVKVQWWRDSAQQTGRMSGTAQQVPTSWTVNRCRLTIDYTESNRDKLPKKAAIVKPLDIKNVVRDLAKKCVATGGQTEGVANLIERNWIMPDKDTRLAVWIDIDSPNQGVKGKKGQPPKGKRPPLKSAASCPQFPW